MRVCRPAFVLARGVGSRHGFVTVCVLLGQRTSTQIGADIAALSHQTELRRQAEDHTVNRPSRGSRPTDAALLLKVRGTDVVA